MLPLRFFPRPRENDLREARESMDVLEDSPGMVLDMLTGGYLLDGFSP